MSDAKPDDTAEPVDTQPIEEPSSLEGADDEGGTRANEPRSDTPWIKPTAD
jgi:hypothetical protein